MTYRRRPSPLHAARAAAALTWFGALTTAALVAQSPLVLGMMLLALLGAAIRVGVSTQFNRALRWAVPLALVICLINALVARDGTTIIWRFGDLPVLGPVNVTLESTVYGAALGLRAALLVLIWALYSLAVDPDDVLTLLRRFSLHSALTATIATRLAPVMVRDSQRLADAQRCRPGAPPGRLQLVRAATSGVLDRALDVAAVLEVRGFALATRGSSRQRRPWSRHDLAFTAAAAALTGLTIASRIVGSAPFSAYPTLTMPTGPRACATALVLAAVIFAPLSGRRGTV